MAVKWHIVLILFTIFFLIWARNRFWNIKNRKLEIDPIERSARIQFFPIIFFSLKILEKQIMAKIEPEPL